ncbi:MAG: fumarylacetoacetate hydrolase, partial [Verrucomicrobia bacterium]|nr:fumarylacetoacetate hydrolase [Verrucomicrobiota bacterium]
MDISNYKIVHDYRPTNVVPEDGHVGTWVGRVWVPASLASNQIAGPRVVTLRAGQVCDLSGMFATMSVLVNHTNPAAALRAAGDHGQLPRLCSLSDLLTNSLFINRADDLRDEKRIVLLAPNDLLATKACGVTFVRSLLERVVDEKA